MTAKNEAKSESRIKIVIGLLLVIAICLVILTYFVASDLLAYDIKKVGDFCKSNPQSCDSVAIAYQLGRLDLVSVCLAFLGVIVGLSAVFGFFSIKEKSEVIANEVAHGCATTIAKQSANNIANDVAKKVASEISEEHAKAIANQTIRKFVEEDAKGMILRKVEDLMKEYKSTQTSQEQKATTVPKPNDADWGEHL